MAMKIDTKAREEILEELNEMEQEMLEKEMQEWETEYYLDELDRENSGKYAPYFCPECGKPEFNQRACCVSCGFSHLVPVESWSDYDYVESTIDLYDWSEW